MSPRTKTKHGHILLIDGDLMMYQTLAATEREECWDEAEEIWHLTNNLSEFKTSIQRKLKDIQERLGGNVIVTLSSSTNFRKGIWPEYKANRKNVRKPVGFKPAREWMQEEFKAIIKEGLEADDVMGILATKLGNDGAIIVSMDKDMKGIPGQLYRWKTLELLTIDERAADHQFFMQVLTGDSTDNYPGVPGIGEVKASAILSKPGDPWDNVLAAYRKAGLTEQDALIQARVARILRWSDWDNENQRPRLWTPVPSGDRPLQPEAAVG